MRPAAGATLCRNHKAAPAGAPVSEGTILASSSGSAAEPSERAGAAPSASGELVAGVLAGLVLVAVAAWAMIRGTSSSSTSAPSNVRELRAVAS